MIASIPKEIADKNPDEALVTIRKATEEVKAVLKRRFARRDGLIEIEKRVQQKWESANVNEVGADEDSSQGKFLCTFPYPYMNGKLHLGHAFTLCKAEFAARFQRLLGKKVLFPFGFHCTGMPIAACAEKLEKEIKQFGNPPQFPVEEDKPEEKKDEGKKGRMCSSLFLLIYYVGKGKKKGKAAKKKSKKKFQWQILEEMNVPKDVLAKFKDPQQWLSYFPPVAIEDLKRLGVMVDWRRSFITTDTNPFYDAFVRWQFNRLKAAGKVVKAKRMCVFSPSNGQPCADHDRAEGEGVQPQEYTLIKIELEKVPESIKNIVKADVPVYLAAATLRPETMYGQTNCWLLPNGEYSVVKMNNGDVFVVSARSALNMSFQELCGNPNKPNILGSIKGEELLGLPLKAPLCKYERVYTMPLLTISMGKGTGVVTSVPSDAPADYAAWMDLKKDNKLRKKYGITEEMVSLDIVPIIDTPLEGASADDRKLPAPYLCKKMKIKSQNAVDKLETAKKECYKISNAKGTMIVEELKGCPVMEAKEKVKASMIANGQAVTYYEPQEKVVARAGNEECVCAMTEQWFLQYGEEKWQKVVADHIDSTLECYNAKAKNMFEFTIGWLKQWACSRTAGLGTLLPWDKDFLIESLSDSTIYMAYYTIAHFVQGGALNGGDYKGNASRIQPEDLTDQVFDYIFADPKKEAEIPTESKIPPETLTKMRKEFLFWYPLDLRVSGKDLIRNHLTMSLYNHAAIWSDNADMWPRSFYTNGHVMINSEKMSKSTGNFLTLEDAINKFGTDACRVALADSGDGLEDANFVQKTADQAILKLSTLKDWVSEVAEAKNLRGGPADKSFFDRAFDQEMNHLAALTKEAYSNMKFREAIVNGFYGMLSARDFYREYSPSMHAGLVKKWIKVQCILLAPICPHFCEDLWSQVSSFIGTTGMLVQNKWPDIPSPDSVVIEELSYLRKLANNMRSQASKAKKKLKKDPTAVQIQVSTKTPEWKTHIMNVMKESLEKSGEFLDNKSLAQSFKSIEAFKKNKKLAKTAMSYVAQIKSDYKREGKSALQLGTNFDEKALLETSTEFLMRGTVLKKIDVVMVEGDNKSQAEPGKPSFSFSVE
eukprot:jgi/Bigna1/54300/estExt_Genewise1Plus.C_310109